MQGVDLLCFSGALVGVTFLLTFLYYDHTRSRKIDDLTTKNEILRTEVTFLKKPVNELKDELSKEWHKKIDKITQKMEQQQNHHTRELDALERTFTRELKKKDRDIGTLQEKVTTLEGEVSDLEHVRSDLITLQDEHHTLRDELRELNYKNRTLKNKVKEYEDLIYTRKKLTRAVQGPRYPRRSTYDPHMRAKALYDLKKTGLSYGEIAKKTGIKKGTVKGTIARYKKQLLPSSPPVSSTDAATSKITEDADHEALEH